MPRALESHTWPWPSPWLTNAASFPEYPSQSPHLFLWDWCLFLDNWVLQRQYQETMPIPGQGMSEISWQHGRLEGEILEGGWRSRSWVLRESCFLNQRPAPRLDWLILQVEIFTTSTAGRSTACYKLSGESFGSVWQYRKVCALTQHFCFQESISQSFLCNCAKIKV